VSVETSRATTPNAPNRGDRRWLAFAIPAFLTALLAAGPYVTFSFSRVPLNAAVPAHIVFLSLHGLAAGTALLLGPLQFIRRIRADHARAHRTIGAVYLLAVLVGSVMALAAAIISRSGWSAQVGFVILDSFWFYTGFKALRAAQGRDFAAHRIWMIRNYSATFAAVLLRVILIVETALLPLIGIHFPAAAAYDVSVWGSITISILVAELFIVQRSIRPILPARLATSVPQQD
jgi:Predicted membrane protein (DUF2306)